MSTTTEARPLHVIAREIQADWKNVWFGAKPYLAAMHQMTDMSDTFFNERARDIVSYFIGNAAHWKGETARRVKAELRSMLKAAR